jgi:hypothetical protein
MRAGLLRRALPWRLYRRRAGVILPFLLRMDRKPMRLPALALLFCFALSPIAATAQIWPNETGLGGDLFASSSRQFDRIRAQPQAVVQPGPVALPMGQAPVPMLDWTPPPATAPARTAPRRTARAPVRRPAPTRQAAPEAPAPATPVVNTQEWERSLAERERNLEALRRRLDEDRRLYEARRTTPATSPVTGGTPPATPR